MCDASPAHLNLARTTRTLTQNEHEALFVDPDEALFVDPDDPEGPAM